MKAASQSSSDLDQSRRLLVELRLDAGLSQVESLMQRLARGGRVDRTGMMALEHLDSGGKRFRARLTLMAGNALRIDAQDSVCLAAAVELLHNATLIHDDIQDEDTTRRDQPTLWVKHGMAQALNAGDYMLMLPFLALGEMISKDRGDLCLLLAETATRVVRGQVEEMGLRSAHRFDWESYLSAAAGKTGALIALPILGAALLAGRSRAHAEGLAELFVRAGVLFQVQDDIVDLFGDKGRREVGCDIYEGKVSALVVAQLERAPRSTNEVLEILDKRRQETTHADVARMQELMLRSGALHQVLQMVQTERQQILAAEELRQEPELRRITEPLLARVLSPIAQLLPQPEALDEGFSPALEVLA